MYVDDYDTQFSNGLCVALTQDGNGIRPVHSCAYRYGWFKCTQDLREDMYYSGFVCIHVVIVAKL